MTTNDDSLLQALASLPPISPDLGRQALIQRRCHSVMDKRQSGARLLDVAAATGLFAYLVVALSEALNF